MRNYELHSHKTIVLLLAIATCGCNQKVAVNSRTIKPIVSVYYVISIFLGDIGLSNNDFDLGHFESEKSFIIAIKKAISKTNCELIEVSPIQYLSMNSIGATPPWLLVDSQGSISLLTGRFEYDGQTSLQVIKRDGPPETVAESELSKPTLRAFYIKHNTSSTRGTVINIGDNRVRVLPTYHNFGFVLPYAKVDATYRFINEGKRTITVAERPSTSCGCTIAKYEPGLKIPPNKSWQLEVETQASEDSFSNVVSVSLLNENTNDKLLVNLKSTGFVPKSITMSPKFLDFGFIPENGSVKRDITLIENPGDRFDVQNINIGKYDFTVENKNVTNNEGNRVHRFTLALGSRGMNEGENLGSIKILTSSKYRPILNVNFKAIMEERVQVFPSKLFFGTVGRGQKEVRRIDFKVPGKKNLYDIIMLETPKGLECEQISEDEHSHINVTLTESEPGIVSKQIKLTIRYKDHTIKKIVDCIGFIK